MRERKIHITMFVAGCLFISFIYHLIMFTVYRRKRGALLFSLLSFVFMLDVLFGQELIFHSLFPWVDMLTEERIQTVGLFMINPQFTGYIYYVYEGETNLPIYVAFWIVASMYSIVILFVSPILFQQVWNSYILVYIAGILYIIYYTMRMMLVKNVYSYFILIGAAIGAGIGAHDILVDLEHLDHPYIRRFVWLVILFPQALILILKNRTINRENEILMRKLDISYNELKQSYDTKGNTQN